jgi:biopolymer transport protein ExbD
MEEKEFSYINMVPFIDVMLVLLTIVLLTSTFVMSGVIPVELPKVEGKHEEMVKSVSVEINNRGELFFRNRAVTLDELKEQAEAMPRSVPFLIRADNHIPLQRFVEVLDVIKTMGFTHVSVQTEWVGR